MPSGSHSALAVAAAVTSITAACTAGSSSVDCDKKPSEDSMAAAVAELRILLGQPPGWQQLVAYYGSEERCLAGHLKESITAKGVISVSVAHARILKTLGYRREKRLDRADVLHAIETARCRSFWPYAFSDDAPDGSPVEICRLSRLSVPRILANFPEDEVIDFFALWCEHTTRLYGASVRAGKSTNGSFHVYDCQGVSWTTLISDARRHWSTVTRVFSVGQDHWPDVSSRYFVIHAPFAVHYLWKLISPLAGEHTRQKVSFSKGVPPELIAALGGEGAVERMLQCSPHVAPES